MKARFLFPALAALAFFPVPVAALSCLAPDPVRAFAAANDAPEFYMAVIGRFSGGPGPRPEGAMNGESRSYIVQFDGRPISRNGLEAAMTGPVEIVETCLAAWCPEFPVDVQVLTFMQVDAQGRPLKVEIDACYGNVFTDPTVEQLQLVQGCFASGDCTGN